MTTDTQTSLELALLDTVDKELTIMQSFCCDPFPCDIATTVAMRMSRSAVSAICSVAMPGVQHPVVSQTTSTALQAANASLEKLSKQYEMKLSQLPASAAEWKIWIA